MPFPAGGTTDLLARLFAQRLSETLGQTAVVENRGGGGGSIGADVVAKAPPDGHTLLFHNLTFSTTTAALEYAGRAPHSIERDFAPITMGAERAADAAGDPVACRRATSGSSSPTPRVAPTCSTAPPAPAAP